jgi:UDP-N-acetylglucosamine 2-epimerase (non-hydrolysing)
MAAAIVGAKLGLMVGHIEAGLRSFDRTMPEELNRVIADQASDLLFIHSPEAETNLLAEGRPAGAIHDVGNTMIDTLVAMRGRIARADAPAAHGLDPGGYVVVTLHRPALIDGPLLQPVMAALAALSADLTVVFPVHPRTRAAMAARGIGAGSARVRLLEPLGYVEFMSLVQGAAAVLTDSGGIQEETTFLGIPCFTLRDNTERPVTCTHGTNTLLGLDPRRIGDIPERVTRARARVAAPPARWDGHAAERIVDVLASLPAARPRSATPAIRPPDALGAAQIPGRM